MNLLPKALMRWRLATFPALALIIAACSSASTGGGGTSAGSSSGDSPGLAAAQKAVAAAAVAPSGQLKPPGPAFNAGKVKGDSIWVVAPLSIAFNVYNIDGLKQAAAVAGVHVHTCDGQAELPTTAACISEAIAAHANLIMTESVLPQSLAVPIGRAKAAGIPVVAVEAADPGPIPANFPPGVVAMVNQCHACAGRLMADMAIVLTKGHVNGTILWPAASSGIGIPQIDGIKQTFSKLCPSCNIRVIDSPIPEWATQLGSTTSATLAANPDTNVLLPLYDGMVPYMTSAVAGAQTSGGPPKITSYNATPSAMQELARGGPVAGEVGSNAVEWGWYWADQAFRVLAGVQPVTNEGPPIRVFTSANIKSINVSAPQTTWYGSVNYQRDFEQLWHLSG